MKMFGRVVRWMLCVKWRIFETKHNVYCNKIHRLLRVEVVEIVDASTCDMLLNVHQ